jgi:BirA family biotin operon repressor/biotin-[acetyl-CoA-carboxylase] ligase
LGTEAGHGTGPRPAGTGARPTGAGPRPEPAGDHPAGTARWPEGTGPWPQGTGPWPQGTGPWPEGTGPWPQGTGRLILDRIDSTNAEAARRAAGLAAPCWILAHRQLAGRGRRGRVWVMPEGNFAATLFLRPDAAPDRIALRSFAAALALREALAAAAPGADLALKWPNDVLLSGGKVAGILLESTAPARGPGHLCIGIGVNLAAAPDPGALEPGALAPVSLRAATGVTIAPEAFLDLLAPALARWEARLVAEGFVPLRDAWLAAAARLGQTITARTGSRSRTGRFRTIDDDGNLILDTAAGPERIAAAEIFF